MTPTDTLLASLDPDPVLRGRQFERFVVTLLRTHPLWASELAEVWPWAAWPGRWGPDCGIDAVARTHDGRTIAIQAKAYAPGHRITKADLDTFVSESARPGIDGRMLVATTDILAPNADRLCTDLVPPVTRVLRSHLDHALDGWDIPSLVGDHPSGKPPPRPAPRPHQSEAITAVVDGLASSDRGQLLMACGTGKTLTTLWIAETLGSECTLVLVPSLGLLSQTLHEWIRAASGPLHTLCVCSDDTVRASDDAPISRASDLGIPATTDPAVVTRFLASHGRRVVFSTYQSSAVITQAQADPAVPAFDLVVADEAHRIAGDAGEAYKAALDPSRIRATRRIFATATPRIFSPSVRKAAADRGVDVTGMDDDERFGPVLHRLPFGEAITRDLLTDYRVVIMVIDDATVAEWVTSRELLRTPEGGTRDARSVATLVGLLKAIRDYGLHRVISFHGRVAGAQGFARDLGSSATWVRGDHLPEGTIEARLVSGAMPAGERRRDLDWLRAAGNGRRGILTNARCLSEGIDVPSLDGVAFIDPKRSQVDITQAVGRAIRKSPGKELGTIVLPVFVRPGDDARAMVEASDFRDVWGVIAALRAQDPSLGAELDAIRTRMGREPGYRPATQDLSRIVIDVPMTVGFEVGDAIRTAVVEEGTDTWEFWFGLLEAYVAGNGHCRVPASHVTGDHHRLGIWVNNIRAGRILLTDLRRSKLEALPGWTWDLFETLWDEGFARLEAYRAGKGDCLVPANHVTGDGYQLGIWVGTQRAKRTTMPAERRGRLETLPGWTWDAIETQWQEGFARLEAYVADKGDCRVPGNHVTGDDYRLGQWVGVQRTKRTTIPAERRGRLETLPGWTWDARDEQWEDGFARLEAYVSDTGDCRVPKDHVTGDGYRLGQWVAVQRTKRTTIPAERKSRLEALNGWTWHAKDTQWEEGFARLEAYVSDTGDCRVPRSHVTGDGYQLGQWVNNQRAKRETMTLDRMARIDALPGWTWDPFDSKWEEGFTRLEAYVTDKGDCRVRTDHVAGDGYRLGAWVHQQRTKRTTMPADRKIRIEALPGWAWDAIETQWEDGFARLEAYVAGKGDCRVPRGHVTSDGSRLGQWVDVQRRNRTTMSAERKSRLEALSGWTWDARDTKWDEGFAQLESYVADKGDCRVPGNHVTGDDYRLGGWVAKQRATRTTMTAERKSLLEALPGWTWDARPTSRGAVKNAEDDGGTS